MEEVVEQLREKGKSEEYIKGYTEATDENFSYFEFIMAKKQCGFSALQAVTNFIDTEDIEHLAWAISFCNMLAALYNFSQEDINNAMKHVTEEVNNSPLGEMMKGRMKQ